MENLELKSTSASTACHIVGQAAATVILYSEQTSHSGWLLLFIQLVRPVLNSALYKKLSAQDYIEI
jgi:hypothetical protein